MTKQRRVIHRTKRPTSDCGSFGPDSVEVAGRHIRIGDEYATSFAVIGYPAEVGVGWLNNLFSYPARLNVSIHLEPIPTAEAASHLQRQRARLESSRRLDLDHDRLQQPEVEAAAEDAAALAEMLVRGEGRLFRVGLYVTVYANTLEELQSHISQIRAVTSSLLLNSVPVTFRQLQGWSTTLPLCSDLVRLRRTFDTAALAAAFPFGSPDLPTPSHGQGVMYGTGIGSSNLVMWDRWTQDNHNSVILARSGAGKSYLAKLDVLRSLYSGVEITVIDPEDEYTRLGAAVGGTQISLGAPNVRLNPFDLTINAGTAALSRRSLFIHTLISVMIGQPLTPKTRAVLDRAITLAYNKAGITMDSRTWRRPAPLMNDLVKALTTDQNPDAVALADQIIPYVTGSFKRLLDGPTTTQPVGHLVIFSLRDLPEELKAMGTLLALDTIWRQVSNPTEQRRRLIVVDEAWLLMRDRAGAEFLYRLAKSARKYWAGLVVITQDAEDLLHTDLGKAVVNNAATHILLRQSSQAMVTITETFGLSDREHNYLLAAQRGDGLLVSGRHRAAFHAIASRIEHSLITSDPGELHANQISVKE